MNATCNQTITPDSPLTNSRHETFAQLVAGGKSETGAYFEVYKTKSRNVARINASRLLTNASVRARIRFLQDQNAAANALSRAEKRFILAKIARGENPANPSAPNGPQENTPPPPSVKDRISAIQEDNRMTGDAEDKIHLSGSFTLNW